MGSRVAPDWPRMMRRSTAVLYCDTNSKAFEVEVFKGRLPQPVSFCGEEMWSRVSLDEALERLTGERMPNWRKECNLYAGRDAA